METLEKIVNRILEKKVSSALLVGSFAGLLAMRIFIEHFLAMAVPATAHEIMVEYIHDFYFFSLSFLLIGVIFSLVTRIRLSKLAAFFAWGFFLMVIPPIFDMIATGGSVFWSFYVLGSPRELWLNFITFFNHLPSGIVYFGTKIAFFLSIALLAVVAFFKTKSYLKTIAAVVASYTVLFFMGAFPSFFYYAYIWLTRTGKISAVHSFDIVLFFGLPTKIFGIVFPSLKYNLAYELNYVYFICLMVVLMVLFWINSRQKFWAMLKNLRLPQIIYHLGMFFIGMGLAFLQYRDNFQLGFFSITAVVIMAISISLSWLATVVVNDINDFKIDSISNAKRPLPQKIFTVEEYSQFGWACFLLAILGGLTIGPPFAIILAAYQILAWFYSASPYRLKKFPLIATLISSIASLTILFSGYILVSDNQTLQGLSWRIIILLLISYTISLPIKDFKDIAGDMADGVLTIPVILGEKKGRLMVATGVFISYALSVFFLNEFRLFYWAMFFGATTFIIINNEEVKPHKLPAWVLGLVSIYTIILIKIVFIR